MSRLTEQASQLIQCEFAVRECRRFVSQAFLAGDVLTALQAAKRWRENVAVASEVAKGKAIN